MFDHRYKFLYICVCVDVIVSVSAILKSAKVVVCVFFLISNSMECKQYSTLIEGSVHN